MLERNLIVTNLSNKILLVVALVHLISSAHNAEVTNETPTSASDHKYAVSELLRQRRSYYTTKDSLHCPPCQQLHCYKHQRNRLHCKGGYTVGVCGCCRVCAKVENELCGGEHNYLGRCDKGLVCEPLPPAQVTFLKDGVKTVYNVHKGICKKDSKKLSSDPHQCKPKCDPDYCMKSPRAICSAKENAEKLNQCEGSCQHTSCRACRFVEPEKQCPKCAPDDFKCIKVFGRCIRKKTCKPKSYPCGNETAVKKAKGEFLCSVPECDKGD